ncbi:unnamed protein product, partial [Brugia timori]|uniref:Uncharacterized protein n=1 Tax=Brugia timori TaxID=42155 RepID=A0A0R3QPL1_9BILA
MMLTAEKILLFIKYHRYNVYLKRCSYSLQHLFTSILSKVDL